MRASRFLRGVAIPLFGSSTLCHTGQVCTTDRRIILTYSTSFQLTLFLARRHSSQAGRHPISTTGALRQTRCAMSVCLTSFGEGETSGEALVSRSNTVKLNNNLDDFTSWNSFDVGFEILGEASWEDLEHGGTCCLPDQNDPK